MNNNNNNKVRKHTLFSDKVLWQFFRHTHHSQLVACWKNKGMNWRRTFSIHWIWFVDFKLSMECQTKFPVLSFSKISPIFNSLMVDMCSELVWSAGRFLSCSMTSKSRSDEHEWSGYNYLSNKPLQNLEILLFLLCNCKLWRSCYNSKNISGKGFKSYFWLQFKYLISHSWSMVLHDISPFDGSFMQYNW